MNNIKISIAFALLMFTAFTSCRRLPDNVSQVVQASKPTITILGTQFYSIKVGGAIPSVAATAYDSVLMESYPVSLDATSIDVNTPGLYVVPISAKNRYGYINSTNVLVAVTDIDESWNLAGEYARTANGAIVNLVEVGNGLYEVDNVGGAPTFPVVGYFVQIDSATIDFPLQNTAEAGDLDCINEMLRTVPDTAYGWNVVNASFGTAFRTFVKQ